MPWDWTLFAAVMSVAALIRTPPKKPDHRSSQDLVATMLVNLGLAVLSTSLLASLIYRMPQ